MKQDDLSERGTHGGPKQQRKIRGQVERTTLPEVKPGRGIRRARRRLEERRKDGHQAGSLKAR